MPIRRPIVSIIASSLLLAGCVNITVVAPTAPTGIVFPTRNPHPVAPATPTPRRTLVPPPSGWTVQSCPPTATGWYGDFQALNNASSTAQWGGCLVPDSVAALIEYRDRLLARGYPAGLYPAGTSFATDLAAWRARLASASPYDAEVGRLAGALRVARDALAEPALRQCVDAVRDDLVRAFDLEIRALPGVQGFLSPSDVDQALKDLAEADKLNRGVADAPSC